MEMMHFEKNASWNLSKKSEKKQLKNNHTMLPALGSKRGDNTFLANLKQ